jgi:hypothetical protein
MTALQTIIKEAKAIRKRSPKIEWKTAVKQASAIYASKNKGKKTVTKKKTVKKTAKKKAVGSVKKKTAKKVARKRVGVVKKATTMHKDTKSHNVRISVMSGVSNKALNDLKQVLNKIQIFEKQILNHKVAIKNTKNTDHKNIYKKQLTSLKKYLSELKTHARELKKHI